MSASSEQPSYSKEKLDVVYRVINITVSNDVVTAHQQYYYANRDFAKFMVVKMGGPRETYNSAIRMDTVKVSKNPESDRYYGAIVEKLHESQPDPSLVAEYEDYVKQKALEKLTDEEKRVLRLQ